MTLFAGGLGATTKAGTISTGLIRKMPAGAIASQNLPFAQRLFVSEHFGITSSYIGNTVTRIPVSRMNVPNRLIKIGWSTRAVNGGGMQIRIGVGTSPSNLNIARFHGYIPRTFVPNSFANPSIQVKLSLDKLSKK